jgi:hypothetical protein
MKKLFIAIAALMVLAACNNKQGAAPQTGGEDASNVNAAEETTTYLAAIDSFLVNEFGKQYAQGEHCVPLLNVVAADEQKEDDILVWGDFWVFNYNLVGDTLKCVSGGSHPGLMHVRKTDNGFEVTAFDQVEDGSRFLPTAKKIFGDKFVPFQAVNSDEKGREKRRAEGLAEYVKKQGLNATMYQDTGWPAKTLATE